MVIIKILEAFGIVALGMMLVVFLPIYIKEEIFKNK